MNISILKRLMLKMILFFCPEATRARIRRETVDRLMADPDLHFRTLSPGDADRARLILSFLVEKTLIPKRK